MRLPLRPWRWLGYLGLGLFGLFVLVGLTRLVAGSTAPCALQRLMQGWGVSIAWAGCTPGQDAFCPSGCCIGTRVYDEPTGCTVQGSACVPTGWKRRTLECLSQCLPNPADPPKECRWENGTCGLYPVQDLSRLSCCTAPPTPTPPPPPVLTLEFACDVWGVNDWCRAGGRLRATGEDPSGGQVQVSGTLGDPGNTPITCQGQGTCTAEVPLPEGKGTAQARVTSAYGEASGEQPWQYDPTPPELQYRLNPAAPDGANGWYVTAPQVTVTGSDATSGIAALRVSPDGGTTWHASPWTVPDGQYTLLVQAVDGAGNITQAQVPVTVDTTPPQVEYDVPAPTGNAGWHVVPVTVRVGGQDATSGLAGAWVSVDGGPWEAGEVTLDRDGVYEVRFRARDAAGNEAQAGPVTVKVDVTPPQVQAQVQPGEPDGANGWYVTAPQVTVTGSDTTSGVVAWEVSPDGGVTWYPSPWTVPDGQYYLLARVVDEAGHTAQQVLAVKVDTTPPQVDYDVPAPTGNEGWHVAPVTVRVGGQDATSGLAGAWVSVDGGPWQAGEVTLDRDGVYEVRFRAQDAAGNEAQAGPVTVKVDVTPPQVQWGAEWDGPLGCAPTLTGSITDGTGSGVAGAALSWDGGQTWQALDLDANGRWQVQPDVRSWPEGTYEALIRAWDRAGLQQEARHAFQVSNPAPHIVVAPLGTGARWMFWETLRFEVRTTCLPIAQMRIVVEGPEANRTETWDTRTWPGPGATGDAPRVYAVEWRWDTAWDDGRYAPPGEYPVRFEAWDAWGRKWMELGWLVVPVMSGPSPTPEPRPSATPTPTAGVATATPTMGVGFVPPTAVVPPTVGPGPGDGWAGVATATPVPSPTPGPWWGRLMPWRPTATPRPLGGVATATPLPTATAVPAHTGLVGQAPSWAKTVVVGALFAGVVAALAAAYYRRLYAEWRARVNAWFAAWRQQQAEAEAAAAQEAAAAPGLDPWEEAADEGHPEVRGGFAVLSAASSPKASQEGMSLAEWKAYDNEQLARYERIQQADLAFDAEVGEEESQTEAAGTPPWFERWAWVDGIDTALNARTALGNTSIQARQWKNNPERYAISIDNPNWAQRGLRWVRRTWARRWGKPPAFFDKLDEALRTGGPFAEDARAILDDWDLKVGGGYSRATIKRKVSRGVVKGVLKPKALGWSALISIVPNVITYGFGSKKHLGLRSPEFVASTLVDFGVNVALGLVTAGIVALLMLALPVEGSVAAVGSLGLGIGIAVSWGWSVIGGPEWAEGLKQRWAQAIRRAGQEPPPDPDELLEDWPNTPDGLAP